MSWHSQSSENTGYFHHRHKSVALILVVLLLVSTGVTVVATPALATSDTATDRTVIGSLKHAVLTVYNRFLPGTDMPEPTPALSPEGAVLGDTDTEDTDIASLERRLSSLENHLTLNAADSSSFIPSVLSTTTTNLLRNSSFESAEGEKPRQWTYLYDSTSANSGQSKEGIRTGAHGLKFIGATSTGSGLNLGISQPETETVPNRTYTFSVYLKHTNITSNTSIRIGFWDKYNNRFGPMKTITLSAGNKDWYRITTTVTTTGSITDHANWYPMLEVRGLRDGAAVYMDDSQLEEGSLLTLYNSALAGGYSGSIAFLGMGSVLGTTTGTLYPADSGVGSLGSMENKWSELYLSNASITKSGDLSLEGSATVGSNLTVNGEAHLKGALKLNSISYLFPSAQGAASSFLMNDGAGGLSWGTLGAASVTPDSLDFAQFVDAMMLDADTSINLYDGAARNLRFYNSNSGAEMLFLNGSTGNVGIGTTSPEVNLEIVKGIRPELRLNAGSSTPGGSGPRISFYAPNSPAALDNKNFAITTNIGNVSQSASKIGTIVNQFQILRIRDSGSFNAVLLSINPDGNTTIGPSGGAHEGEARLTLLGNSLGESQLRLRSNRQGIAAGNTIGGIDFASNDTNLASPGVVTSSIKALAAATHTDSVLDTALTFSVTNGTTFSEAMRINSSGNVGIGTTAPRYPVDIVVGNSGSTGFAIGRSGGDPYFTIAENGGVRITGSGGVGSLTVIGDISATAGYVGSENYNTRYQGGYTHINASNNVTVNIDTINASGSRYFAVYRDAQNGSGTELFRVQGDGNVGIGTTAPGERLEIDGNIKFSKEVDRIISIADSTTDSVNGGNLTIKAGRAGGAAHAGALILSAGDAPSLVGGNGGNLIFTATNATGGGFGGNVIFTAGSSVGNGRIGGGFSFTGGTGGNNAGPGGGFSVTTGNGYPNGPSNGGNITLRTGSGGNGGSYGNIIMVQDGGNVGIGTTNPAYKLDVAGDINTTGDIRKNGAAYNNPDYVFEPDYDLMSLDALKSYVATNKHLPNVPSSEDIRRDGVKLFEQTRLNLEKTEEAYLYLFDLDDRVSALSLSLPATTPALASVQSTQTTLTLDDDTAAQLAALLGDVEQGTDGAWSVQGEVHFFERLVAHAQALFEQAVTFLAEVRFGDRVTFADKDMGGKAVIKAGQEAVSIEFVKAYETDPLIQVTPLDQDADFFVADVSAHGFTIALVAPAQRETQFNWLAVHITDSRTVESTDSVVVTPESTTTPEVTPSPTPEPILAPESQNEMATPSAALRLEGPESEEATTASQSAEPTE